MKSYTDLEQSKILAKILKLESADMCYIKGKAQLGFLYEEYKEFGDSVLQGYEPCWTLVALLRVLPQTVRLVGTSKDSYWYCECVSANNQEYAGFGSADNPIDACYDMIIKLYKLNLL
jgi:hypothetical protein